LRFGRAAHKAASFTKLAGPAPDKIPAFPAHAMIDKSTSSAIGTLRGAREKEEKRISLAALHIWPSHDTRRSNSPARSSAGSSTPAGRSSNQNQAFVGLKSSISNSNAFPVCSRSSMTAAKSSPRLTPTASGFHQMK